MRAATSAVLMLAAGQALAHAGHDHDSPAASVLHLLFGLHGWPTLLAWASAVGTAAAVGALAVRLTRRMPHAKRRSARSAATSQHAS
ncbi:MAG: hypothetical protein AB1832_05060 [Pseudomonadota bacterium]